MIPTGDDAIGCEEEKLVYTSESVEDTVNPEWNEFGNPLDIAQEAKDQRGVDSSPLFISSVHAPCLEQGSTRR